MVELCVIVDFLNNHGYPKLTEKDIEDKYRYLFVIDEYILAVIIYETREDILEVSHISVTNDIPDQRISRECFGNKNVFDAIVEDLIDKIDTFIYYFGFSEIIIHCENNKIAKKLIESGYIEDVTSSDENIYVKKIWS